VLGIAGVTAVTGVVGALALVTACGDATVPDREEMTDDAGVDGSTLLSSGLDASLQGDALAIGTDAATGADGGTETTDAGGNLAFSYHPSWAGVSMVTVWGQFGNANDWKAPFLTLNSDGSGTFSGSADLPPGTYPYILQATGDADGPDGGAATKRYVVDPTSAGLTACPAASPTYQAGVMNPCSQLTVPSSGAAPLHHVAGTITNAGHPAAGWIVQIERSESPYHHFFADRTTTGADGTFDLPVAPGGYQLFVENPAFLSGTDAELRPGELATYRRELSNAFTVAGDVTTTPPSVAYTTYGQMGPRGDAGALPTTFLFRVPPLGTKLAVYSGKTATIGDPWFTSDLVVDGGSAVFDGGFDTPQAGDAGAPGAGDRYFWGVEDQLGLDGTTHGSGPDAGLQWTGQSMVFAISWQ
jgi:hypothetical protein